MATRDITKAQSLGMRAGWFGSISLVALFCAATTPVAAQTTTEPAADKQRAIETVIVTAQRREQKLDDVAAAVSAVGADQIQIQRIENVDDLIGQMSTISYRSPSPDSGFLTIRGATSGSDGPGQDQGVSVYIDDIYANGPGDIPHDFFDLDRIEVLRGPQGTLFGRNVTGGLIAFYTKPPSFTPGWGAEITHGNYNLWQGSAYLNGPLSDMLAGRVNFFATKRNGYAKSSITGDTVGDQQIWSFRGQLLFRPNDGLSIRVGYEHNDTDSQGPGNQQFGDAPLPGAPSSFDPDVTNTFEPGYFRRKSDNAFLRADWNIGFATLTSVTGYRRSTESEETVSFADPGTTLGFLPSPLPFYIVNLAPPEKDRVWTEELRLTSPSDRRFTWLAGFYYINSSRERNEAVINGLAAVLIGSGAQHQSIDLKGWSIFADGTYHVSDTFALTVGARFTHESKDGTTTKTGLFAASPLETASYSGSWESVTPRFVATYKPSEHVLVYGLVSRGFRGGGFDFGGAEASTFNGQYQPENVWNYEAGTRTNWFNHQLTFNAVAYRANYTDLQLRLTSFAGGIPTSVTSNAGSAYSRGLELELAAHPTDWLTFGANATFQKSVLTDYASGGTLLHDIPTTSSPARAYTLFGSIDLPTPEDIGALRFDWSLKHRSTEYFFPTDPFTGVPNTVGERFIHSKTKVDAEINASLTWTSSNKRYEVQLWAKNLTNERNIEFGFNWQPLAAAFYGQPGSNYFLVTYNDPRTFGLTLRIRD
jgi:iron complex outermembrane receptor protein